MSNYDGGANIGQLTKPRPAINEIIIGNTKIDPVNLITLDIFESLFKPEITGVIIFNDYSNIVSKFGIGLESPVEITFKQYGSTSSPLTVKMEVEKMSSTIQLSKMNDVITLTLIDRWTAQAKKTFILPKNITSNNISKEWKITKEDFNTNKKKVRIDQIIKALVYQALLKLNNTEYTIDEDNWTETQQALDIYSPPQDKNILENIEYLLNYATNIPEKLDQKEPLTDSWGMTLFTNIETKKIALLSIADLIHPKKNYGDAGFEIIPNYIGNEHSPSNIKKMSNQSNIDNNKFIEFGFGKIKYTIYEKKLNKVLTEKDIIALPSWYIGQDTIKYAKFGNTLPIKKTFYNLDYGREESQINLSFSQDSVFDSTSSDLEYFAKSFIAAKLSRNLIKLIAYNVETPGEQGQKRVGKQIHAKVLQTGGFFDKINEMVSGMFIITNIRHRISHFVYTNSFTIAKIGYNKDKVAQEGLINAKDNEEVELLEKLSNPKNNYNFSDFENIVDKTKAFIASLKSIGTSEMIDNGKDLTKTTDALKLSGYEKKIP